MRGIFVHLILSVFLLISSGRADEKKTNCIIRAIAKLKKKTKTEFITDQVEIIWYPKSELVVLSHTELKVGDVVYDAFIHLKERGSINESMEAAMRGNKGFLRFKLAVTKEELQRLEDYINAHNGINRGFDSCVAGVCKVIKKNTGIIIPFPFDRVPSLNALYLTLMKTLGYKRILKVEYVGKNKLKNLLTLETPAELYTSYTAIKIAGFLIVYAIDAVDKVIRLVIPVEEDDEEEKKNQDTNIPQNRNK